MFCVAQMVGWKEDATNQFPYANGVVESAKLFVKLMSKHQLNNIQCEEAYNMFMPCKLPLSDRYCI
jgi:hypothetical protein